MNFSKLNLRFLFFLVLTAITSLLIAFYVLGDDLSNQYVIQDDFRQTNFWFWNFWDNSLFTNDLFTNNFKGAFNLAPLYLGIFKLAPLITDNLISFSKYYAVVLAVLTAIAAYAFYSEETKGNYFQAAIFASFMAFIVWTTDHLSAAHVRSSIWLIIFLYLFFKLRKLDSWAGLLCGIALFFNPSAFLLVYLAEFVPLFMDLKFKIKEYFTKYTKTVSFLIINAAITLIYHFVIRGGVSYTGEGQRLTVAEMKSMAEFNPGGRHPVFGADLWHDFGASWWMSEHWGIGIGYLMISKILIVAFVLAIAYLIVKLFIKKSLNKNIFSNPVAVLFYSAVILNVLAQITFPTLYMPSRYLGVPMLLIACFLIFKISTDLFCFFATELNEMKIKVNKMIVINLLLVILAVLLFFAFKKAVHPRFVSVNPAMARLVSALPKSSMVAGFPLLPDINSLSIFSKRNIFIDYERSMSYTKSTLDEIRRRNLVAIQMTFAQTKEEFLNLANANGITHFLALNDLYSPQYLNSARYIEPYNKYLKRKIYDAKGNFFLKQYLDQRKQRYSLIDVAKL